MKPEINGAFTGESLSEQSLINITITGNTISSQMDIDSIGRQLVERLKIAGVIS
jgi:hypothetical protein